MSKIFQPTRLHPRLRDYARALRDNSTDAERALWQSIRGQQLGVRFRRQHTVEPFILDFYCIALKLAVELDGGQHNDEGGRLDDAARTNFLQASGITVVRYWNNDVLANIDSVLAHLCAEIERIRADRVPPPLPSPAGGGD